MPQTPPPEVDVLPEAPSSQNPIPFAGIMDTFLAALAPFRSGMIALVTNCYNNAMDAYDSAVGAAASLAAVVAAGGATEWVSGATYEYGVVVWSPIDFLPYRRKVAGAGTTDPSDDATNWAPLNGLSDSSTTSNSIGTGEKTFTVSPGKGFRGGMYLVIADTAAPSTNSMTGQVTSYNTGTGELVMSILNATGSGTKTAWTISQTAILSWATIYTTAGGTADAITGGFSTVIASLTDGMELSLRGVALNATATPTFTPNPGTIAAKTIVKGNGKALLAGDMDGVAILKWHSGFDKWVLLNPAYGVHNPLGYKQAGVDVSGSRNPGGVVYTNSSESPIIVSFSGIASTGGNTLTLVAGSMTYVSGVQADSQYVGVCGIVQPGEDYSITLSAGTFVTGWSWREASY
jgi:hypothetical protein